jgi:FkbM family methyltransferase
MPQATEVGKEANRTGTLDGALGRRPLLDPAVLASRRERLMRLEVLPESPHVEELLDYTVRINDGPNFYMLCKDIFCQRIYHFECSRPDPLILDCGANIGLSILYFKHVYPGSRITAFEPDPGILPILRDNLLTNGLEDVRLVEAAVAGRAGQQRMLCDGLYESRLVSSSPSSTGISATTLVPCVRLRDYLAEPVDFLKMNIEGAEGEVLQDCAGRLSHVRRMVLEYHHQEGARPLHEILALIDGEGFDYLIHDFDAQTNPWTKPPFRLGHDSRYFLLIFAQQRGACL